MKKLLLTLAICVLMCALFVIGASAATAVTDDGSNVTLGNCTIANSGVTIPSPTRGLAYSLDDETGTATVTGKGSFAGGEGTSLVIPSSVTYNGKTYPVETISAGVFKNMTFNLYIPDSLVTIAGGGYNGAFGSCVIDKAYLGCGIKTFGRETFSTASGFSVFFCQAKPEIIDIYAINNDLPYRIGLFDDEIEYIKTFNPNTQMSIEKQNNIDIYPINELLYEYSDDIINNIKAITLEDVIKVSKEYLRLDEMAFSAVGKVKTKKEYDCILRDAIGNSECGIATGKK